MSFHKYTALLGAVCAASLTSGQALAQTADSADLLTMGEAVNRALQDTPILRVSEAASRAADASIRQADRALNPSIDVLVENGLGTGYYSGLNRAESTLTFNQTIERGGDRQARTQLAVRQGERIKVEGDIARQDLAFEVATAYVDAQRAASERQIAEARLGIARETLTTVQRRVEAARDPLLASSRSLTVVAEAEIALENAKRAESAALANLATFWLGRPDFQVETASFSDVDDDGSLRSHEAPEIVAARAAEREADARIAVERARAKLDPTVSAGVRYFSDNNEAAFVVGFSIPLGINDNNSGAIDRASADRLRAQYEGEALRRSLDRQTASARSQMSIASSEIASLDARLLPAAQDAVTRARQGYEQGGFSYLDVLDAQRVLANAQVQRVSALSAYHRARLALIRLMGGYAVQSPQ